MGIHSVTLMDEDWKIIVKDLIAEDENLPDKDKSRVHLKAIIELILRSTHLDKNQILDEMERGE